MLLILQIAIGVALVPVMWWMLVGVGWLAGWCWVMLDVTWTCLRIICSPSTYRFTEPPSTFRPLSPAPVPMPDDSHRR